MCIFPREALYIPGDLRYTFYRETPGSFRARNIEERGLRDAEDQRVRAAGKPGPGV